jgi:hypothetical protein
MSEADDFDFLEGSEEARRLERFLETILWMAWPQRPGFLGVPLELRGQLPTGEDAAFARRGSEWWFVVPAQGRDELVDPAHVGHLMAGAHFLPSSVVVVPEIAHHVYLAAIIETEAAHQSWRQALREVLKAVPDARRFFTDRAYFDALILDTQDPMGFVMATDAMDACVRHSVTAIPLAIAAADAQVNTWANGRGGLSEMEQRKGLAVRYQLLAKRVGVDLSQDEEPLLSLRERLRLRNDLIHGNAIAEEQPLEQRGAGRPLVLEARRSCLVVRQALLLLAEMLDETPPKFLAFCPEAPAEDDESWRNARVLTGMRQDSVFPKAGSTIDTD